jgi:predicted metal-dependent peptidase
MNNEEKAQFIIDNHKRLWRLITETNAYVLTTKDTKFMASKLMSTPTEFKANLPMATACTDGKSIWIDPEFWDKLGLKERAWTDCHELLHIILMHPHRSAIIRADNHVWNIAADAVVNAVLNMAHIGKQVEGTIGCDYSGNVTLKINDKDILIEEAHKKTVDWVYSKLLEHITKNPPPPGSNAQPLEDGNMKGDGGGESQGDGNQDGMEGNGYGNNDVKTKDGKDVKAFDDHMKEEMTATEVDQAKRAMRRMLVEAKMRGDMPTFMQDMLEDEVKPKVNWKVLVRNDISPSFRVYNSFVRPHRRSQAMGFTMPGPVKKGIKVTLAIDTSGSIGKRELDQFVSDMRNIFKTFPAAEINLMLHTTNVYYQKKMRNIMDCKKLKYGSGGTSHIEVFEKAEEMDTKILICLTDACTEWPEKTRIPNVVIISTDKNAMEQIPKKFKKIHLEIEELGGR